MGFGEKIRSARREAHLTQTELAKAAGLSLRTVQFYEKGERSPQTADILLRLAKALRVPSSYLLSDDELNRMRSQDAFLEKADERFGPRGKGQAQKLLEQTSALFAGGNLSENDRDRFFETMTAIYFDAKKRAKKYGHAKRTAKNGRPE